jgi:hypothetical protein
VFRLSAAGAGCRNNNHVTLRRRLPVSGQRPVQVGKPIIWAGRYELFHLRRRIAAFTMESDSIKVDTATIKRKVSAAMRTTRPEHCCELFLVWIKEVVLNMREREAEITFRVPFKGANCQSQERNSDDYILLKTQVRVDA